MTKNFDLEGKLTAKGKPREVYQAQKEKELVKASPALFHLEGCFPPGDRGLP